MSNTPVSLALYHYVGCPYCAWVVDVIEELGIDVEMRDIMRDRVHREALIAARGRGTVPVLAITDAGGETTWMPESRDIMAWLRHHAERASGDID